MSTPATLLLSVSTPQRPKNFRVCQNNNSGNKAGTAIAPIAFLYSVETNLSSMSLSLEAKEAIVSSVSAAIIDKIYEYDCPTRRTLSSSSSLRRMEIQSISPGNGHEWLGECFSPGTGEGSSDSDSSSSSSSGSNIDNNINTSCNEIDGTVVIGFDETGSGPSDFRSIGTIVLTRIQEDMTNGNYLEKLNIDIQNLNVTVTKMNYIDSDYFELVDQNIFASLNAGLDSNLSAQQTGMTVFSKAAIPVMVVLFLLAMGLCWCAFSSCPTEVIFWKNYKKEEVDEESEGSPYSKDSRHLSTLHKPKAGHLSYVKAHPRHLSRLSSTMDVYPNSGRDGRLCPKGKDDQDLSSSSTTCSDDVNKSKQRRNNEEDEVIPPSLEATLKDLSEAEMKSYDMYGHRQTFSTLPIGNTNTRMNRFLPIPIRRSKSQSMIYVEEGSHPSDTETDNEKSGCSTSSSGLHEDSSTDSVIELYEDCSNDSVIESEINFVKVEDPESVCSKLKGQKKQQQQQHHATHPVLPSSRRVFPFFFKSIDSQKGVRNNPSPDIDLVERVTCTSSDNNCLRDTKEIPAPDSITVINYIPKSSNPLVAKVTPIPSINTALPPTRRISGKKSAAYREYINNKMLQRNHSMEGTDCEDNVSMEIGLKRSVVDERGTIREMVAL
mmetsp:Transcript_54012/g.62395  ORF Transcript_54012/g.62395 Transcript_54012/m.62395 type:complete len:660 (+) Transcript_54012:178-2157(+)|eukprot:CAMPEP_0170783920 /NCGR_PEP_ID=MMETSP0733-20121128/15844_1 /TAXON_ID=186038 /ORGANISM="Fragilariopsis kerguelensis, Strain L26-C5" /LENGTH=659 /DNA_ID=CAMNT_0011128767 /DNA_START=145 /DNA_END=2124 /DNA_ORIENTATION=+